LVDSDATSAGFNALHTWLAQHGVRKHKSKLFLAASGCRTVKDLALYLRFQLPPLRLADRASIATELHELLGVGSHSAHRIVADLNITGTPFFQSILLPPPSVTGPADSKRQKLEKPS
jgi:hypothetical protein